MDGKIWILWIQVKSCHQWQDELSTNGTTALSVAKPHHSSVVPVGLPPYATYTSLKFQACFLHHPCPNVWMLLFYVFNRFIIKYHKQFSHPKFHWIWGFPSFAVHRTCGMPRMSSPASRTRCGHQGRQFFTCKDGWLYGCTGVLKGEPTTATA